MIDLDGRVALVTGAGRGLGRAEALELGRLGARVVVNDHGVGPDGTTGSNPAHDVVAEITEAGGTAIAHVGDVSDFDDAGALVQQAIDRWGDLDIVVNNAGFLRDRMVFSMTPEEWDAVIRVHLRGHFCVTRHATAHWRERMKATGEPQYARVINTASEAWLFGSAGQPNYAAAKAGIVALTMATANGAAKYGVRANCICPRARTRMTAQVFGAAPEDGGVAGPDGAQVDPLAPEHLGPLVSFLASPAAQDVNGQVFVAYGPQVTLLRPPSPEATFVSPEGMWGTDDLASAISDHFEQRDPDRSFVASELRSLGG